MLAHDGDLQVVSAQCNTEEAARTLSESWWRRKRSRCSASTSIRAAIESPEGALCAAPAQWWLGEKLVVAESATGGGLAQRITSVSGSSAYFVGGFVTYSKRMKSELLGVPSVLIDAAWNSQPRSGSGQWRKARVK